MNAVTSFWFNQPQVMAFHALGLAAICAARIKVHAEVKFVSRYVAFLPLLIAIMLVGAVIEQGKGIVYGVTFYQLKFAKVTPKPPEDREWMKSDIAQGGDRLMFFANSYLEDLTKKIEEGTATDHDRDWYRLFIQFTRETGKQQNSNAFLRILEPHLSMRLLFDFTTPSLLDALKPEVRQTIFDSVLRFTQSAPKREDFIVPFLMNIGEISGGDTHKEQVMLQQLLDIHPEHRSALWLLGSIYETLPEMREKGVAMKRQAVSLGVERVYPVTEKEAAAYRI
jgi:hypothetical protein